MIQFRRKTTGDHTHQKHVAKRVLRSSLVSIAIIWVAGIFFVTIYEQRYRDKIYPSVFIDGISFGGKTPLDIERYWLVRNEPFVSKQFVFTFENNMATVSATDLDIGYDATLSARQAYLVGRSGNIASDFIAKFSPQVNLNPYFRWNGNVIDDTLTYLTDRIDIPVEEALFQFSGGRVAAFKPSHDGRRVNIEDTKQTFKNSLSSIPSLTKSTVDVPVRVDVIKPTIETQQTNILGVKELVGRGYSEFAHSIPGRIHNVILTASKINGVLIKPGETFSFNDTVGDISAETGFAPAYIIKDGRTVLGDGGGVCQVSTTLFRAALAAGLPIIKRQAHAYRVAYYEQAGYKAGLDATVFAPSVDFQFKNDTPGYILIQTSVDRRNLTLTIDLYGTSDGRTTQILNHIVGSITPPPPDLYQDDPTLPAGTVKQVDFAAWGAKASFQYKVTRNGEILQDQTFYSNFRPWQAVFLRGPQI